MILTRVAALFATLVVTATLALAQTADEPVMGGEAIAPDTEVQRILVVGDAIGGGLGAGMKRMAEAQGGSIDITLRFNEESGLARPEVYDWTATLPKILESNDFDVAVVLIGSNDRQQIRDGNLRLAFGTEDWEAAYVARLDRVLDVLKASEARIYWISIPPMADPAYDQAMRYIADVHRARAEAKGATFLDVRPQFLDADGRYTDTGVDDTGETRKLRGRDGVSFFKQGNNRFGQIVLAAIAENQPVAPAKVADAPEPGAPAASAVPLFGQAGPFGENLMMEPVDVASAVTLIASGKSDAPGTPGVALGALQSMARQGSGAALLFQSGEASPAPPGRLDDFRAPVP